MVRRPPPPIDPTTSSSSPVGSTSTPAALQSVPRWRPRPEPSRMATLKRLLRKSGFSRGAACEMSGGIRESTARLYQSQWLSFCGWCRGRGVAPVDATVPLIADFLIHLRKDKGFSLSALKGYHSAMNSILALKGIDLSTSRELSILAYIYDITCTTDTAQTPVHPALMYNIFTSTLGVKCMLPVSYTRQQPRAAPAEPHLTSHFIYRRHRGRCSSAYSLSPKTYTQ